MQIIYTGQPSQASPTTPKHFEIFEVTALSDPRGYHPDPGLIDAVNVSLRLGQPLLVTGEPGTGKTELAGSLAWELGLGEVQKFETKSTTTSKDLFYDFDYVRRFRDAQSAKGELQPSEYITYNAFGMAILKTRSAEEIKAFVPSTHQHAGPSRSVVLIDEIDKAPRDFPNDILNELDRMYFRVAELGQLLISAAQQLRPIVIITSNSEKALPDPFLRRCIYYNIPFPDEDQLERIVASRLGLVASDKASPVPAAITFFMMLRNESQGMRKRPGTAELLNWISALYMSGVTADQEFKAKASTALSTLSALAKHAEDQNSVIKAFKEWVHK